MALVSRLPWRRRPAVSVTPDEVPLAPAPYVRPTHAAGTGGRPTPTVAQLLARPRRSDEPLAPAEVRTPH